GVVTLAGFFILVLVSNVTFFSFLAFTRLGQPFYEGVSAVQSRATIWSRWHWRAGPIGQLATHAERRDAGRVGPTENLLGRLRFINPDIRALLLKDARTFWRDTTQWGQSVMLFGLLGVYVINLRHFTHQLSNPFWVN